MCPGFRFLVVGCLWVMDVYWVLGPGDTGIVYCWWASGNANQSARTLRWARRCVWSWSRIWSGVRPDIDLTPIEMSVVFISGESASRRQASWLGMLFKWSLESRNMSVNCCLQSRNSW